ncbi:MAG TPA: hypothetical protein ENO22_03880 [candidate division Zixibacteria bacterium]|nr:hypothetical protein [candidate division Zixibacteria bacterium]HEQ98464.1 hypothetical protein [candidate division Zixibacteria bacterium]
MPKEKGILVDVGMKGMPFPFRVLSREESEGQYTIANLSVIARIDNRFESRWIDKFIQIIHKNRFKVGTQTLHESIADYLKELKATMVRVDFDYPFFVEKKLPATGEKCLVRYMCTYNAKLSSVGDNPKIIFKIHVPAITTDPASDPEKEGGLFGQLSVVTIEVDSRKEIFPEDLVDLVDKYSISPVYSYLNPEDQIFIIQKAHTVEVSSTYLTEQLKTELANNRYVDWFSVKCSNFGMLHSYNTGIGTEKDLWMPFHSIDE